MTPEEHVRSVQEWRAVREDRLRSPEGWLTLVGLYWLEQGENLDRPKAEILARRGPEGEKPRIVLLAATPGNEEEVIAGIGDVLPGVPIFGGSAADHAIEGAWSVFTSQGAVKSAVSIAFYEQQGYERSGVIFRRHLSPRAT